MRGESLLLTQQGRGKKEEVGGEDKFTVTGCGWRVLFTRGPGMEAGGEGRAG